MTLISDGAEALGLEQGFAFALLNLAWSMGETAGAAGSSRLADGVRRRPAVPDLAGVCSVTLAFFARELARRSPARALASRP